MTSLPRFESPAFAFAAMLAVTGFAAAQTLPPHALPSNGGAGLRTGAIKSTGQTVPDPSALPTAPRSQVGRDLASPESKTDFGICKGC